MRRFRSTILGMSIPVALAGCSGHGGGASCGFAGVAGANLLLGAFAEPNRTLSAPPRRLPAALPVRVVAGAVYTGDVTSADSSVTVTLRDSLPSSIVPGSGVLVQDPSGLTRGIVIYEAMPVAGAPTIGTLVSGRHTAPLVGIQVDLARFEDPKCPTFPDSSSP
jgi:hypothetical protein